VASVRSSSLWFATAVWAQVVAPGCKPTIASLRAEPNVSCPGDPIRLTWRASAGGRISAQPSTAGPDAVEKSGTATVSPAQTTKFQFDSQNCWGQASQAVDVDMPQGAKLIGASAADQSATCDGGSFSVTAVLPLQLWDERLIVTEVEVAPHIARPYNIQHEGRAVDLVPGVRSAVFAGLPARGSWVLATPLQAGEACGVKVPRTLAIDMFLSCGPQGK
jgi:hypothetical protein